MRPSGHVQVKEPGKLRQPWEQSCPSSHSSLSGNRCKDVQKSRRMLVTDKIHQVLIESKWELKMRPTVSYKVMTHGITYSVFVF